MLVRSLIYGWGFDFMRPFHNGTMVLLRIRRAFSMSENDCVIRLLNISV